MLKLLREVFFKTGLRYGRLGYQTSPDYGLRWPSDVKDGVFSPDPNNPNSLEWDYTYNYLELPLVYRQELSQKKLAYFIEIGLLTKFNLSSEYERTFIFMDHNEFETFDLEETHLFDVSLLASVVANYTLNDNVQIFAQPTILYQITSTESHGFNDHLFSVGMEFGVRRLLF